jgi:hypothetical protein
VLLLLLVMVLVLLQLVLRLVLLRLLLVLLVLACGVPARLVSCPGSIRPEGALQGSKTVAVPRHRRLSPPAHPCPCCLFRACS